MMNKIKVLVIDDSAVVRQALTALLESDKQIEVTSAADPFIAAQKMMKEVPDVITLDVEMPRMDGITFLRKIMSQHPIPVIIISSLTEKNTETAIHALELGAIDVLKKPTFDRNDHSDYAQSIIRVVRAASKAVVRRKQVETLRPVINKPAQNMAMIRTTEKLVAIGASTGGTEALVELLQALPVDCPGMVIVQHMPEVFTKSFAERLNRICKITVKEAAHGDSILRGHALIAPGNKHMEVKRSGARYYVEISQGEPVNRHRPSVDVLFSSVSKYAGKNAIGVIMTGMGADGSKGLLQMKEAGAFTIAQDEKSCIVFGMPKEAIRLNAVDKIVALREIAGQIQTAAHAH
ncbi:protein-glutamate methylesterase/protein-glutamine glutaminase [Chryseolinea lacunae]|nr:chemotaxis response regulator protein-glutamate methylesterase [Chryseolinea lacunae]